MSKTKRLSMLAAAVVAVAAFAPVQPTYAHWTSAIHDSHTYTFTTDRGRTCETTVRVTRIENIKVVTTNVFDKIEFSTRTSCTGTPMNMAGRLTLWDSDNKLQAEGLRSTDSFYSCFECNSDAGDSGYLSTGSPDRGYEARQYIYLKLLDARRCTKTGCSYYESWNTVGLPATCRLDFAVPDALTCDKLTASIRDR